jgi:hypothetical protein
MPVDRSHEPDNRTQRERLRALVARLSDADLGRSLDGGWTVASVLGHLAFWDQRALLLIDRWQTEGAAAVPPALDRASVDWINDSAKPLLLAVPPRRAAELALAIAEAVDRKIEALADEFVAKNVAAGRPLNLLRAEHRREHLDEIERAVWPAR